MRTLARLLITAILAGVFASASLAFDCDLFQNVANVETGPLYQDAVDVDLNAGECWTGGEGNGYPTRAWTLEDDAFGGYWVEVTSQKRVDRLVNAVLAGESLQIAFCDGIAL